MESELKREMIRLYKDEKLSCRQVGKKLTLTRGYVNHHLKSFCIDMRTQEEGLKLRFPDKESRRGENSFHWKGGIRLGSVGGKYIYIHKPDHPSMHVHNHFAKGKYVKAKIS